MGRRSAGGYRIAVEGHRWRPADEQERSRLTRIAVDRGAEPQTVPVISAPLILDGPGHPGAGRSSCRCCAVMVVTRLKDAVAAVSRICGRGSPIPIFAQVRGILTIVMHRCAAAIGSAHGRAPRRRRSVPSGPGPTAWWSLVIDSTCQVCATQPRPVLPQRFQACRQCWGGGHSARPGASRCGQGHSTPSGTAIPSPNAQHVPDREGMSPHAQDVPGHGRSTRNFPKAVPSYPTHHPLGHSARPGASRSGQGHSTPSGTAIPSPNAQHVPSRKKVSPHAQAVPTCQRPLGDTAYVGRTQCRAPSASRWHRCPRMAADTTTADTTFVRAALRTIVTIGDS